MIMFYIHKGKVNLFKLVYVVEIGYKVQAGYLLHVEIHMDMCQ